MAEEAARLFYDRLFEIAPELRVMFKGDLKEQGRKLMGTLAIAVAGLERMDTLLPALGELGRRHGRYGVKDEHYDLVGEVLIWTLAAGLGDAFTRETEEAWVKVYGVIASTMKNGASLAVAA